MKHRSWMIFYAFNLFLYALGTLVLAEAGVESLIKHRGNEWKDLLLLPVGVCLCRLAFVLLRREACERGINSNDTETVERSSLAGGPAPGDQ